MSDPLIVVTPCSRPALLNRVAQSFSDTPKDMNVWWYIHVDASKVNTENWKLLFKDLQNNMLHTYPHIKVISREEIRQEKFTTGYGQQNQAIDWIQKSIGKAFIYSLDDDNILHPDLFTTIQKHLKFDKQYKGFIFSQIYNAEPTNESHKWKYDIRLANKEFIKPCYIDTAQYLIHTELIGNTRFVANDYNADGKFIQEIYEKHKDEFLILPQPLCYYNSLNPEKPWIKF